MSNLFIPVRYLNYGLYRVQFTVTMDPVPLNGLLFSSTIESAILIVPSPLIAQVVNSGMNFITAGDESSVKLEAGGFSRDPDVDPEESQVILNSFNCNNPPYLYVL